MPNDFLGFLPEAGPSRPSVFTGLSRMRGQECDRPKCLATELAKTGATVVATADYDTLYVWPLGTQSPEITAWHAENNAGDKLVFHIEGKTVTAEMAE